MKQLPFLLAAAVSLLRPLPAAAVEPANPKATTTARAVLKYFESLSPRTDKRLLSGQFTDFGRGAGLRLMSEIQEKTGHWPALLGADYADFGRGSLDYRAANQAAIEYWRRGGLVTISAHLYNPANPKGGGLRDKGVALDSLLAPDTETHTRWMQELDLLAAGLQDLKEAGLVVLWRPFHEMNGGWFWWGAQDPESFIKVWRHMFDYFSSDKGLNNLLWVYGPNQGQNTAKYYAGPNYVDIVGLDAYTDFIDKVHIRGYDEVVALGKPFGFTEYGPHGSSNPPGDYDYRQFIDGLVKEFPATVFFMSWNAKWSLARNNNTRELLEHPWIVNREDLPAGLVAASPAHPQPPAEATPVVEIASALAAPAGANLALVATASTSYVSGHETITALNDGVDPAHSNDKSHGAYGNWPRTGTQWVQYDWSQPITTSQMAVYWFDDHTGVRLPKACRLLYWDGNSFVPVAKPKGLGVAENRFNVTTFPELTTSKLRLEFDSDGRASTGILEWRVFDSGASPNFPPQVTAGPDRVVVLSGQTYLSGKIKDDGKPSASPRARWSKESGPGRVTFSNADAATTTARFSAVGDYALKLTADDGQLNGADALRVRVDPAPPRTHLEPVWTTAYTLTSPFWRGRAKPLIVNWIPHCIQKINDPKLPEGGIENFVQAANKLAGRPASRHVGYPFANAWVYNTVESICVALLVDPQGDPEITAAQSAMRQTLEDWIPKILSAQEPDGYLHTTYTLSGHPRWSNKADHEGYNAGYFIEAALAHYLLTKGQDTRLWDAALRLADCWYNHLGPAPKKSWYEGHQELEQALVRLARFVDQVQGKGRGAKHLELAKFLLDSRQNGDQYDQSHLPVTRQYEAVGHAVRALYSYSGMTDIAMETGDADYHSAVKSLWESIVQRKYYVTGGVGSGETSEGFGSDYSLPHRAYCESCADCGELFFQHRMQMAYQESRYADLCEETLYNAILGSVDLEARNFTYTNPLDSREARYAWHGCPCCVGNISRTLLMLPTWMYSKGPDSLYVNLFVGSDVSVGNIAGANVRVVQSTDYPWKGKVLLTIHPSAPRRFTVKIRVPSRDVSRLYTSFPNSDGLGALKVNGASVRVDMDRGYAVLSRRWKAGDRIELAVPLRVQRIKTSSQVAANAGRVALRYGPLIYNVESTDQDLDSVLSPTAALSTEWKSDLLGGVMVIKGTYANGKPLTAIPNYARLNRGGRSLVWLRDQ